MENSIILGDFNMHIEDPTDNNYKIFVDTMEALGLKQHVVKPTHQKGNILDLILTEVTSQIKVRELEMFTSSQITDSSQPLLMSRRTYSR